MESLKQSQEHVEPTRPVAGYIGGKRNLARTIVPLIDADRHDTYAEPFVGMGGIFLRRTRRPKAEVINDWSADVATFFRILQRHYVAFTDMLRFQVTTREGFERLVRVDPTTLTDLERAARFLFLQRTTFGGKVNGRTFGVSPSQPGRFDITKLGPLLEDVHSRLAGVVIERLPHAEFIQRYDRPGTLFYLDPPYFEGESDYGAGLFSREDFQLLAVALRGLQGRFILSLNDHPEVRRIFAGWAMREVRTTYTIGGGRQAEKAGELLIASCAALVGS
jgi:DNA adenine methylase